MRTSTYGRSQNTRGVTRRRHTTSRYSITTWPNQWPDGSAYPDYFVIGDPYTNVYEGSASLTDIRLYVPKTAQTPPAWPKEWPGCPVDQWPVGR